MIQICTICHHFPLQIPQYRVLPVSKLRPAECTFSSPREETTDCYMEYLDPWMAQWTDLVRLSLFFQPDPPTCYYPNSLFFDSPLIQMCPSDPLKQSASDSINLHHLLGTHQTRSLLTFLDYSHSCWVSETVTHPTPWTGKEQDSYSAAWE